MPMQSREAAVAVIGAGFSGTLAAINIARMAKFPVKIYLIEKTGNFAQGVAYGTKDSKHLLNVPASNMSAFADDPEHFLKWLGANNHNPEPGKYYPRKIYGEYLSSLLKPEIIKINQPAIDINQDGYALEITLADGKTIKADAAILALGNFPPVITDAQKALFQLERQIFLNPWSQTRQLKNINKSGNILIIGSGLTMVDIASSILDKGHNGKITVISRHGLLPEPHIKNKPQHVLNMPDETNLLKLYKFIMQEVAKAKSANIPWQSVFDALRPHTIATWQKLTLADKKRFDRHLRAWWDTRRHRMPPEVYAHIQNYITQGKLEIKAARICHINSLENYFDVAYKPRGSKEPLIIDKFDYIINCAAPEVNLERSNDKLIQNLLGKDLIRPGPLHMGLKISSNGAVIGKGDYASNVIFALGSLCKGELWETTAVPELRTQADNLAKVILENLQSRPSAIQGVDI